MLSDFWWLSPEERTKYTYADLFHQEPYSDEPNTNKDPCSCPMSRDGRHTLEFIGQWRREHRNVNVFRSFKLYDSDRNDGDAILGPLLLDIDRINKTDRGLIPDIHKALEDVRLLVKTCCTSLADKDYHVFFSGHKGFHVEINPRSLGIPLNADTFKYFERVLKDINKKLGDAFVDKRHHHVRLHNSINSWIDYLGHKIHAMSFEINTTDLYNLTAKDLYEKGEKLARRELGL